MATTIRVNEDDLKRFNGFIGSMQVKLKDNTSQARGFEMLLNRHEGFEETDNMLTSLLEYVYPRQADSSYDNGFNAGWQAALYLAMGAVQDAADEVGRDDFIAWLDSIDDAPLKLWISERYDPDFYSDVEDNQDDN